MRWQKLVMDNEVKVNDKEAMTCNRDENVGDPLQRRSAQENPFSNETGLMTTGGGLPSCVDVGKRNPFGRSNKCMRSPPLTTGNLKSLPDISNEVISDTDLCTQPASNTPAHYQTNKPNKYSQNEDIFEENYRRSNNEEILFQEWKKMHNENSILISNLKDIQNQLDIMKKKYDELEQKINNSNEKEYCTDEEELAKETEWIRKKERKNKKKKIRFIYITAIE